MNLQRTFKMALKSISANKGRSFLTMLGIIIGVAAVIALVSLVKGQQNAILAEFRKMGTNQIQVDYHIWNGADVDYTDELYAYCDSLGSDVVLGISPQIYANGNNEVRYRDKKAEYPNVYLVSDQYTICSGFTINRGRDLCYMDVKRMNKVCLLGSKVADDLFNYENPVGKSITLGGESYTVIGTYASKGVSQEQGGSYYDNIVVVPYTLQSRINKSEYSYSSNHTYIVKAASSEAMSEATRKLNEFFEIRGVSQNGYYGVYANDEYMNYQMEGLAEQGIFLGIIAGIALLVGGIGIMNIMLVTVTERTKEIGIRKAIGAPRRVIITQFLIESSLLSAMGGLLGILLGYGITPVLGKVLPDYASLGVVIMPAPFIVVVSFFVSIAFGIGFGVYPAMRASSLQPVDALRSE